MRIACPSCNAVYQVPDEQLGEGRVVRCVRCGTDWSPVLSVPVDDAGAGVPPEAAPVPVPAAPDSEPISEPISEPPAASVAEPSGETEAAPVRRMALDEDPVVTMAPRPAEAISAAVTPARRGGPWLAIAWVLSMVAVSGGVAALIVWRDAVMQAWPPSVRAYAGVGLAGRQ